MGADPIVYCLEQLTDYDQFERLCNDLMSAEGYKNIEPLGGRSDKGRDAIRVCHSEKGDVTIFAYSVREDWKNKLKQDANRIMEMGHQCDHLVFCCTAHYNATERDEAITFISDDYGWSLELYGIERIRMLLSSTHERILNKHPHIFSPPFFPKAGGQPLSFSPDLIIIDFSESDEAIASWIARKLKLHGYIVWCRSIDPIGGESINDTTESLLEQRAALCLSLLSQPAIENTELSYRRGIAIQIGKKRKSPFLVPVIVQPIYDESLDSNTRSLNKVNFIGSWTSGLNKIIDILESANCPKAEGGKHFALNSFFPADVVIDEDETIISNIFQVLKIPETIHRFESTMSIPASVIGKLSSRWAFRKVNPTTFLSFHTPLEEDISEYKLGKQGGGTWQYINNIDGINVKNLVPELIRKSLVVACQKKGLKFCTETYLPYFPPDLLKSNRYYFDFFDGTKPFIQVYGERKYYRPENSEQFKYYLSPSFHVVEMSNNKYIVILHVHIRLTDVSGNCLQGRKIVSRRKSLCKDWFNDEWSKRIVGIMRFLGTEGRIEIGEAEKEKIVINSYPIKWSVPISINEEALSDESVTVDSFNKESSDTDEE
ncbi:MAG: TIR domain-containing protein [Candidatus Hodarchaeales archaeon]